MRGNTHRNRAKELVWHRALARNHRRGAPAGKIRPKGEHKRQITPSRRCACRHTRRERVWIRFSVVASDRIYIFASVSKKTKKTKKQKGGLLIQKKDDRLSQRRAARPRTFVKVLVVERLIAFRDRRIFHSLFCKLFLAVCAKWNFSFRNRMFSAHKLDFCE